MNKERIQFMIDVKIEEGKWVAISQDELVAVGTTYEEAIRKLKQELILTLIDDKEKFPINSLQSIFFNIKINAHESLETMAFLRLAEDSFSFWDNDEDAVYDNYKHVCVRKWFANFGDSGGRWRYLVN